MFRYVLAETPGLPRDEQFNVLRQSAEEASQRFDYRSNSWVRDEESWWRHCMNSNDYEDITEDEARAIIAKWGGSFDAR